MCRPIRFSFYDDSLLSLSLSKVILLLKPESKPQNKGNTDFRIQMVNNPAPHVVPCISTVVIPTYCSDTQPPSCHDCQVTVHSLCDEYWSDYFSFIWENTFSRITDNPQTQSKLLELELGVCSNYFTCCFSFNIVSLHLRRVSWARVKVVVP